MPSFGHLPAHTLAPSSRPCCSQRHGKTKPSMTSGERRGEEACPSAQRDICSEKMYCTKIPCRQGNKATLVTRLLQDDEKKVLAASPLVSPRVRHASTTEVPGIPSTAPPPSWPKEFMNVKLPNLAKPDPEPQIQIVCRKLDSSR